MSYDNTTAYQCIQALANKGQFTAEEIVKLTQYPNLKGIKDVINGKAEITYPERKWREENGVIYFSYTGDGTTGKEWSKRLKKIGRRLGDIAEKRLKESDFKLTPTGETIHMAVLKGELFSNEDRATLKIRTEALNRGLGLPYEDAICYIREMFADEDLEVMGLWQIINMCSTFNDSDGDPYLLGADRYTFGGWLRAFYVKPAGRWSRDCGFAFSVPPASSDQLTDAIDKPAFAEAMADKQES